MSRGLGDVYKRQVEDGRLHLGTGGGITWDSTPAGEWAETELKAHRLLAVASRSPVGAAAGAGPGLPRR